MNKKIIGVLFLIMLITSAFSVSVTAGGEENPNEPVLQVGVFGASLLGLKQSGFIINNNGEEPIDNIHYTFSIKSISNNNINFSYSDNIVLLNVNSVYVNTFRNQDSGFGLVTISISVTSSNAGGATKTTYGFQIGRFIISKTYLLAWF